MYRSDDLLVRETATDGSDPRDDLMSQLWLKDRQIEVLVKIKELLHKIMLRHMDVIDTDIKREHNQLFQQYLSVRRHASQSRTGPHNSCHSNGSKQITVRPFNPITSRSMPSNKPKIKWIILKKSDNNSGDDVISRLDTKTNEIFVKKYINGIDSQLDDPKTQRVDIHTNESCDRNQWSTNESNPESSVTKTVETNGTASLVLNQTSLPLKVQKKCQWKKIRTSHLDTYFNSTTKLYTCPRDKCKNNVYTDRKKFAEHIRLAHKVPDKACTHKGCNRVFKTNNKLNRHLLRHIKGPALQCTYESCEFKCQWKKSLENHIQRRHLDGQVFRCGHDNCGREFDLLCNLKSHQRVHASEPQFRCRLEDCGKRFQTPSQLMKHKVDDHNLRIACEWPGCDYKAISNFLFREHMRVHTGEKPFPCSWTQCQKSFRTKYNLKLHLKVHQKNS